MQVTCELAILLQNNQVLSNIYKFLSRMENYDVVIKGIVTKWNGTGPDVMSITVAVLSCTMRRKNAIWNFPNRPPLIRFNVQNISQLSKPERANMATPGAEVEIHVTGSGADLKCEVTSTVREERKLEDFLTVLYTGRQ